MDIKFPALSRAVIESLFAKLPSLKGEYAARGAETILRYMDCINDLRAAELSLEDINGMFAPCVADFLSINNTNADAVIAAITILEAIPDAKLQWKDAARSVALAHNDARCRMRAFALLVQMGATDELVQGLIDGDADVHNFLVSHFTSHIPAESLFHRFCGCARTLLLERSNEAKKRSSVAWIKTTSQLLIEMIPNASKEFIFSAPLVQQADFSSMDVGVDADSARKDDAIRRIGHEYSHTQMFDMVSMPLDGYLRATQSASQLAFAPTQAQDHESHGGGYKGTQRRANAVSVKRSRKRPRAKRLSQSQLYKLDDDEEGYLGPIKVSVKSSSVSSTSVTGESMKTSSKKRRVQFVEPQSRKARNKRRRVTTLRRYRQGELPDIEIKLVDITGPLRALCTRDEVVAASFLCSIFHGFCNHLVESGDLDSLLSFCEQFGNGDTDKMVDDDCEVECRGAVSSLNVLESCLGSTLGAAAQLAAQRPSGLVRCIHSVIDIVGEYRHMISPQHSLISVHDIEMSARTAPGNAFSSIRLVENTMLREREVLRLRDRNVKWSGGEDDWLCLVRMYESVREQDVAVGILRRVDEDAARALEDEFFSKEYAYAAQKYKSLKEGCAERAEALGSGANGDAAR